MERGRRRGLGCFIFLTERERERASKTQKATACLFPHILTLKHPQTSSIILNHPNTHRETGADRSRQTEQREQVEKTETEQTDRQTEQTILIKLFDLITALFSYKNNITVV
jgi:hypothetical protein